MPQQTATAAAAGDQASQFSRLPAALLVRILQALPQRERLASCATVCSSWAAAATAATVDVDLPGGSEQVIAAFQPWLQQHARQLVSLTASGRIYGAVPPQLHLPCAELVSLRQLELQGPALVFSGLDSNSTAAGAGRMQLRSGTRVRSGLQLQIGPQLRPGSQLQLLPKLQQLKLARCDLIGVEALLQLSVLTSLTSLQLTDISVSNSHQEAHAQQGIGHQEAHAQQGLGLSNALCTLLAQVQQLEDLKLSCNKLAGSSLSSVMQQLSSLRQLRSACIDIPNRAARTDGLLSALPRGLTGLTVWDNRTINTGVVHLGPFHPTTFPQQMPQLSDLQELDLDAAVLHPGMLSVLKRLQRLRLHSCILLPRCPEWEDAAAADAAASAAASAFLAAVGGMTDLVSLVITDAWDIEHPRGWEAAPAAAFSALTASSKLQELVVHAENELPLPWGAVQHALPAGRVLPHLTKLAFEATSSSGHAVLNQSEGTGFMTAQHLAAVVGACPALVELNISNACESDDLTPLLQLPDSVTRLSLGGSALGDDVAATVAQLTQLQVLDWECSPDLTDAGLEHLTALTGLHGLIMTWCDGLSPEVTDDGAACDQGGMGSVSIHRHQADAEAGTPVWQLLCDRLEKSPQLWPARLLRLKARWQQQVTELQQQLEQARTEAQQQSSVLQQQVAEARQQSAVLQEQSDQRVAETQQQVTELQQQLAELRQQVAQVQERAASGGRRRRG